MIGLKLQNFIWEKTLLALLGEQAEKWQENHPYALILTDCKKEELKNVQLQCPLIGLGKTGLPVSLALPVKKNELEKLLAEQTACCENDAFIWDQHTRRLTHKKTKKVFSLTEKESALLTYLVHQTKHQATKEELLQNVWHYTKETESHTVESTLYALRQKIGNHADELIVLTKNGYRLA